MISKIIQKHRELQSKLLIGCGKNFYWARCENHRCGTRTTSNYQYLCNNCKIERLKHKQSLINLKEYMEDNLEFFEFMVRFITVHGLRSNAKECIELNKKTLEIREDIEELNKMIKRYE